MTPKKRFALCEPDRAFHPTNGAFPARSVIHVNILYTFYEVTSI